MSDQEHPRTEQHHGMGRATGPSPSRRADTSGESRSNQMPLLMEADEATAVRRYRVRLNSAVLRESIRSVWAAVRLRLRKGLDHRSSTDRQEPERSPP